MRSPMTLLAVAAVMLTSALVGCSSSKTSQSATTSTAAKTQATTQAAAPDIACVPNVDKVIAAQPSPASTTAALPAELVTKLDGAAASSAKQVAASGVIVGVRTPQGTWTNAYGLADPAAKTPMTVGTHTRIGSITKTFTGTLILQLVHDGKISLDDTIAKFVAGVPNGDRVTLRMLANMTSGVPSYTFSKKFQEIFFNNPETVITPDEALAFGVAEPAMFEPGAKYFYSNTNILLLGKVVEKVTGQPVETVYRDRIFAPLGLANTSYPGASAVIPDPYAQGSSLQGKGATPQRPTNATSWNPYWAWSAGILISDMNDLLTYGRALGTGQGLLDPATQAQRLTSFPDAPGYGYGLGMGCADGWVGHVGDIPGYNSALYYDTTTDTTVAVQTNSDIASGSCTESPVLADDPGKGAACSIPAVRVFAAVAEALGHPIPFPAQN